VGGFEGGDAIVDAEARSDGEGASIVLLADEIDTIRGRTTITGNGP